MNLVKPQAQPKKFAVMKQNWENLLFLHWKFGPDVVQASLPQGLTVEVWEGKAWVGIVPFFMRKVRPVGFPSIVWLSNFLELNVRTYVRDRYGRSGVWFYSLDCSQPLAVWGALTFFHLPYFHAAMKARVVDNSWIAYESRRAHSDTPAFYSYKSRASYRSAEEGSLEQFLIERYLLFSLKNSQLYTGQVWHYPYEFAPAELANYSTKPLELAGFIPSTQAPDHAVVSPGVKVLIYPLAPVR